MLKIKTLPTWFYEKYSVTPDGKIFSLSYRNTKQKKELALSKTKDGYLKFMLVDGGKGKQFYVHRAVASAFIPNPQNLPILNHKNGVKTDNRTENLEWSDYSKNLLHSYKLNLRGRRRSKGKPDLATIPNRSVKRGDLVCI
jgi:hypothetical protein